METKKYDVVIIGAGPAGLNAALYSSRAGLKTAFLEKNIPGGKTTQTAKIENWLGTELIDGFEYATNIFNHAKKFGADYIYGEAKEIKHLGQNKQKIVLADNSEIESKAVVIATGLKEREPQDIKNYNNYHFKGIHFCATCDGALYKNKNVVVLGGGNSAVEESTFLANMVAHLYLVVRDNDFIAEKSLVNDLKKKKNITILMNSKIEEIQGSSHIEKFIISNKEGKKITIEAEAFFPYIGFIPNSQFLTKLGIVNKNGFIETNENMETKVQGIYAVGDIRDKKVRQIITAASDGAIAAKVIADKLNKGE